MWAHLPKDFVPRTQMGPGVSENLESDRNILEGQPIKEVSWLQTIQVPDGVTLALNKKHRSCCQSVGFEWLVPNQTLFTEFTEEAFYCHSFHGLSVFFNKAEVVTISTTLGSQKISMLTRKGCK